MPTGRTTAHEERFLGVAGISFNTTWEDIVAIMDSLVASGKLKCDDASRIALARSLLLSCDEAERLVEKKLQDERVWAMLRQRRYTEFQKWLRSRAPMIAVGMLGVPLTTVTGASGGAGAGGAGGSAVSPPQPLPLPMELVGAAVTAGGVDPRVALTLAPASIPVSDTEEAEAAAKRARKAARRKQLRDERKAAVEAEDPVALAAAAARREVGAEHVRVHRAKKKR